MQQIDPMNSVLHGVGATIDWDENELQATINDMVSAFSHAAKLKASIKAAMVAAPKV
ncbi:MAG: hypothetical protein WDO73_03155 [Ignavibacteriota bacterium]